MATDIIDPRGILQIYLKSELTLEEAVILGVQHFFCVRSIDALKYAEGGSLDLYLAPIGVDNPDMYKYRIEFYNKKGGANEKRGVSPYSPVFNGQYGREYSGIGAKVIDPQGNEVSRITLGQMHNLEGTVAYRMKLPVEFPPLPDSSRLHTVNLRIK
jgi:hypothetical protein